MTTAEYNQTVDEHSDALMGYLFKLTGQRDDAENLVQGAFEQMWRKRKDIHTETARAWLYRVARNQWIDEKRKMQRITHDIESRPERAEGVEYNGLKEVIDQALNRLSEKHKSIVMLRDYEGYDYRSIGEIMGMNEGQVKVNLFRARKAIKEYIKDLELVL